MEKAVKRLLYVVIGINVALLALLGFILYVNATEAITLSIGYYILTTLSITSLTLFFGVYFEKFKWIDALYILVAVAIIGFTLYMTYKGFQVNKYLNQDNANGFFNTIKDVYSKYKFVNETGSNQNMIIAFVAQCVFNIMTFFRAVSKDI